MGAGGIGPPKLDESSPPMGAGGNGFNGDEPGYLKRKRSEHGVGYSPGSDIDDSLELGENGDGRLRQPGVKRACNECRQQKLRCDVIQDPFKICTRCTRLRLECKIESNFKRVGKRSKHAEMEKQIDRLKQRLRRARSQGFLADDDDDEDDSPTNGFGHSTPVSAFNNSDEAVSSLLHLKRGGSFPNVRSYTLEDVSITSEQATQLFCDYFNFYHQFIPFLDENRSPDHYMQQSPLLFWAIIAVAARRTTIFDYKLIEKLNAPLQRLMWTTVGGIPQNHHVVKALCLICTWPIPTSLTTTDPTHIIGGVMMKCATGMGLHRPSHHQDFSRNAPDLDADELHDRVTTWAVCNIVAQTLGTGYGMPASTLYDWTLTKRGEMPGRTDPFALSSELDSRIQIEKLCDKISKECYSNATDPIGLSGDEFRSYLTRIFRRDHTDLMHLQDKPSVSPLIEMWHKAAGVHLHLSAFFDSSETRSYTEDLTRLHKATVNFLDCVFNIEDSTRFLQYGTNYLSQMLVVSGFVLLKLLNSFFAADINNYDRDRELFFRVVGAVKAISVTANDLSHRLSDLMTLMWNSIVKEAEGPQAMGRVDNSMQLKLRCRHSMSLVFDTVYHWREAFQARGKVGAVTVSEGNAVKTDGGMSAQQVLAQLDTTLLPPSHAMHGGQNLNAGMGNMYCDDSFAVFDPLGWSLDNWCDFNYNYTAI